MQRDAGCRCCWTQYETKKKKYFLKISLYRKRYFQVVSTQIAYKGINLVVSGSYYQTTDLAGFSRKMTIYSFFFLMPRRKSFNITLCWFKQQIHYLISIFCNGISNSSPRVEIYYQLKKAKGKWRSSGFRMGIVNGS